MMFNVDKNYLEEVLTMVVYYLLIARKQGEIKECIVNGHHLSSETVTMDSAFMEVFGCKKNEVEEIKQEWVKEMELEEEKKAIEAKKKIPYWVNEGKKYIYPKLFSDWESYVLESTVDVCHGKEIEDALELMKAGKNGSSIEDLVKLFWKQKHTEMSTELEIETLLLFHKQGPELIQELNKEEALDPETNFLIQLYKRENEILESSSSSEKRMVLKERK